MAKALRRAVDAASVLTAIGVVAGLGYYLSSDYREHQRITALTGDVERFRQTISFRAAANQSEVNNRGWPTTVDPSWFGNDPPRNPLLTGDHPWVEVAAADEAGLTDPPVRVALDSSVAGFWYNPYQGIVRARVPMVLSEKQALDLYNKVNRTRLETVFGPQPIAAAEAPVPPIDPSLLFGPPKPEDLMVNAEEGPPKP